jgi:hypothetical protein
VTGPAPKSRHDRIAVYCDTTTKLDIKTLVWTWGDQFRIDQLQIRLKCSHRGSRRPYHAHVMHVPKIMLGANAPVGEDEDRYLVKDGGLVYAKAIASAQMVTVLNSCPAVEEAPCFNAYNSAMENQKMLTKTKLALAAALILGPASAVLANDTATDDRGGGPAQTWQDIARDAQDIQNQIKSQYHTGTAGSDYGYVKPSKPTRHSSPEATQNH